MKTNQFVAEVELQYSPGIPLDDLPIIDTPEKAHKLLRSLWDPATIQLYETFKILLLKGAKRCLGWIVISQGGSNSTIV